MRSRSFRWLLAKDVRELVVSRAWWLVLLMLGLLIGHAFLTAIGTYAEMSGNPNAAAALSQGLSPLDGIVAPTLGMISLAATLLLPFVVIRVMAHEKRSGAWKLLVQGPASVSALVSSKVLVLLVGWVVAGIPALIAVAWWRAAGNHLDVRETAAVFVGHALFTWFAIGVAAAAAACCESEASAAIVALGVTIGTWALDFVGEARGGIFGELARYTPTSVLRSFEHGLVRLDATIVLFIVGGAGVALTMIWLHTGARYSSRMMRSAAVCAGAAALMAISLPLHTSWDWSEDRRNSFPLADEHALRQIQKPLQIEIHLAPEDPRMVDFEANVLAKLERTLPDVQVKYLAHTRTGMFEQPGEGYGEIWYQIDGKRSMSRSSTSEIVLALLYELGGVTAPGVAESGYPGYPLVGAPSEVAVFFFVVWPLTVLAGFLRFGRVARFGFSRTSTRSGTQA